MGIKFHCPNGHKLNVKSFLAGKRGICPHCGAKVRIPGEAQLEEDHENALQTAANPGTATAVAAAPAKTTPDTSTFKINVARPAGGPAAATTQALAASPVAPVASAAVVSSTPAAAVPAGVRPAMPVPGVPVGAAPVGGAVPAMVDPIAEAPNAVWYVRPPSGGQFGPARGDILRKWLTEGRVTADSLVWRDGWTDWKQAATVFPSLAPVTPLGAGPVGGVAVPGLASAAANSPGRAGRTRRKSNGLGMTMVIVLGLIAVVLLGILFVVVMPGMGG